MQAVAARGVIVIEREHPGDYPPKNRLRIFMVQILEYFDSKSITEEIVRTPASNILISGQQI